MLKIISIISFIFWFTTHSFSQTENDYKAVLQDCLNQKTLFSTVEPVNIEGQEYIIIFDNGVTPNHLAFTCKGYAVKIMPKQDLFFYNVSFEQCLTFDSINFDKMMATVRASYKNKIFQFNFSKPEGKWKLIE